jgi:hypothetical protein
MNADAAAGLKGWRRATCWGCKDRPLLANDAPEQDAANRMRLGLDSTPIQALANS